MGGVNKMIEKTEIDCNDLSIESYQKFLSSKLSTFYSVKGRKVFINNVIFDIEKLKDTSDCSDFLFDYQKFIVNLALQKQRYAVFGDCGLGKTLIFLEFIKKLKYILKGKKIMIISPLAVIKQTIAEELKFYGESTIKNLHKQDFYEWLNDENAEQIGIINFDKFRNSLILKGKVGAVILDESSILKSGIGVIRNNIIDTFRSVPFKLCCTATPAPNDRQEYANHSTFLEYTRSNNEFFAKFFVNKENGWEIKPHGLKYFYEELSNWSIYLRNPENYGFNNNIKDLPVPEFIIENIKWTDEQKKYMKRSYIGDSNDDIFTRKNYYLQLSKGFIRNGNKFTYVDSGKFNHIIDILEKNPDKQTIIWTVYNEEEKIIKNLLKEKGYSLNNINGSTPEEQRSYIVRDFSEKKFQILISKPRLLGFGINLPFVTVHIFNGMNDSYEQFYQAVRRSYRYGATEQLKVYIPVTHAESKVLNNVMSKKDTFEIDSINQEKHFVSNLKNELNKFRGEEMETKNVFAETVSKENTGENWKLYMADSIIKLRDMEKESIDFSVFSPPFSSLFTYSEKLGDIGNSREGNEEEFSLHFEFFLKGLFDVMKSGRNVCCHVQQLSTFKSLDGFVGTKDFRGCVIELFQKSGFIYFGEFTIKKNPQIQAIRNKVRSLSFSQLEKSRIGSKPGYNDSVLIFKKPGDSVVDVNDETGPSRDEWINWATGVWNDIKGTDTLNTYSAKSEDDVKHICPLQLEVIRRCIRLYTNKGEIVLDPFNGIGSCGVVSLELQRKYIGIELKKEYYDESVKNFRKIGILDINKIKKENIRNILKDSKVLDSQSIYDFD